MEVQSCVRAVSCAPTVHKIEGFQCIGVAVERKQIPELL